MTWSEDKEVAERFDTKVERSAGCWLWRGGRAGAGYGVFRLNHPRRMAYAHRLALERKLGRRLVGREQALHSCDTPLCVNPEHLRVGTIGQNMADRSERGRTARGERHGTARLTETQVREIMALSAVPGLTQSKIAVRYGLSRTQVSNIVNGRAWQSITVPR